MKRTLRLITSTICFALCGVSVHGSLSYWDANGAGAGAGASGAPGGQWGYETWWSPSAAGTAPTGVWTPDDTAVFAAGTDATNNYQVDLFGDQVHLAGMKFEEGKVTVGPSSTLFLTGAGGPVDVASGASASVSSVIGGTVGLTKTGSGTLFFINTLTHTYTSVDGTNVSTTINGGALSVGNGGVSGGELKDDSSRITVHYITNNAALIFDRAGTVPTFYGVISGTGSLILQGGPTPASATLKLSSLFTNTFSGGVIINYGRLICGGRSARCIPTGPGKGNVFVNTNGVLDLAGNDTQINGLSGFGTVTDFGNSDGSIKTNILTVGDNDQSSTFAGFIESVGARGVGLTKIGTGTLTLTGANTYKMGTLLQAGTLLVNSISGSGTGTGAVTNSGGTLGGNGIIGGPVRIEAGGTLSPGASIGTLILNSSLTLLGNLFVEVNNSPSPTNDLVKVTGALTNAGTGTVTVANLGPALAVGNSFRLFSKALLNGGAMTIVSTGGGVVWNNNLAVDGSISVASVSGSVARPRITSISGAGTASVTVNFTNTVVGTNYTLQFNTNLNTTTWFDVGTTQAVSTSASTIDGSATSAQRYYRVKFLSP